MASSRCDNLHLVRKMDRYGWKQKTLFQHKRLRFFFAFIQELFSIWTFDAKKIGIKVLQKIELHSVVWFFVQDSIVIQETRFFHKILLIKTNTFYNNTIAFFYDAFFLHILSRLSILYVFIQEGFLFSVFSTNLQFNELPAKLNSFSV